MNPGVDRRFLSPELLEAWFSSDTFRQDIEEAAKTFPALRDTLEQVIEEATQERGEEHRIKLIRAILSCVLFAECARESEGKVELFQTCAAAGLEYCVAESPTTEPLLQRACLRWTTRATNLVSRVSTKKIQEMETLTGCSTVTEGNGNGISVTNVSSLTGSLGVSAAKLLDVVLAYLWQANANKPLGKMQNVIHFPLNVYCEKCGFSVVPNKMGTQAEQEKEDRRANACLRQAVRDIRRDFENLSLIVFKHDKPDQTGYKDFVFITEHAVENGVVECVVNERFLKYVKENGYTQRYLTGALRVPNIMQNAYAILSKLSEHYQMPHNVQIGTNNRISVQSLLNVCPSIPGIGTGTDKHWKTRTKGVLEKNLNTLVDLGLVGEWYYQRDGKRISRAKVSGGKSSDFLKTMIHFELPDIDLTRAKSCKKRKNGPATSGKADNSRKRAKKP